MLSSPSFVLVVSFSYLIHNGIIIIYIMVCYRPRNLSVPLSTSHPVESVQQIVILNGNTVVSYKLN